MKTTQKELYGGRSKDYLVWKRKVGKYKCCGRSQGRREPYEHVSRTYVDELRKILD
jgi:hypothetical protein